MKTPTQCIRELIRVLGRPHSMLVFPLVIWDEHWDGIRICRSGYELFQIIDIPFEERDQFAGAEEMESILESDKLFPEDEEMIQRILEQFLIES